MTDTTKPQAADASESLTERIRMIKDTRLPPADSNVVQHRERNPLREFVDSSTRMLEIQRKRPRAPTTSTASSCSTATASSWRS
jgi:hypothetical protein